MDAFYGCIAVEGSHVPRGMPDSLHSFGSDAMARPMAHARHLERECVLEHELRNRLKKAQKVSNRSKSHAENDEFQWVSIVSMNFTAKKAKNDDFLRGLGFCSSLWLLRCSCDRWPWWTKGAWPPCPRASWPKCEI